MNLDALREGEVLAPPVPELALVVEPPREDLAFRVDCECVSRAARHCRHLESAYSLHMRQVPL